MRAPHGFRPSLLALFAASLLTLGCHGSLFGSGEVTTVVVVRHAEKGTDSPYDPTLSDAGRRRAEALAAALDGAGVSAIYSTQFKRTLATAEPLAKRFGLKVIERPITQANGPTYGGDLARDVLAQQKGKTVVVVGHSNTVPDIVWAFGHIPITPLTDADYDQLFIVEVPAEGPARLFRTRYGEANP